MADESLRLRLELGDLSARIVFQRKIAASKHPSYWWQFVRDSWLDHYLPDLEHELFRRSQDSSLGWEKPFFQTDDMTSAIVRALDSRTAERLLAEHWEHLRYERHFVQAALFVATVRCKEMVAEAVGACPNPREMFEHLGLSWRIGGREERGRLRDDRLEALEPYLDLFDDSTVHHLWSACNVDGFYTWRRKHLDSRLGSPWRRRSGLDESGLWEDLDRIGDGRRPIADFWIEGFEHRGDPDGRAFEVLKRWLQDRRTLQALEVAAACLMVSAKRSDLEVLEVEGAPRGPEADAVRADARFAVLSRSLT